MIIEEITLSDSEANQETQPLLLAEQSTIITVNTIKDLSKRTLNQLGYFTAVSIFFEGQEVQVSHRAEWGNNINEFSMPRNSEQIFKGYVFFYSPYTTRSPQFQDFGTTYKLFYSDTFAFDEDDDLHDEFIKKLRTYFA